MNDLDDKLKLRFIKNRLSFITDTLSLVDKEIASVGDLSPALKVAISFQLKQLASRLECVTKDDLKKDLGLGGDEL